MGGLVAGRLCGWLNEAIRRVYCTLATAAYPVGVPPSVQSQFHVDDGGFSTCILHRLAAMVLVTLDGSESASERKAHLALGLRNAFANSKVDTSRFSRAITTTTALQRSHIHPMQLVIFSCYKHLPVRCTSVPLSHIHLLTILMPFLQADVDSR